MGALAERDMCLRWGTGRWRREAATLMRAAICDVICLLIVSMFIDVEAISSE
jgi:hypothetical protein